MATSKILQPHQYNELLRRVRDPDHVPRWQLVQAFRALRDTYHVANQLMLDIQAQNDVQSVWRSVHSAVWVANFALARGVGVESREEADAPA